MAPSAAVSGAASGVGGESAGSSAAAPAPASPEAANDTAPADGAEAEAQEKTEERMEGAAPEAAQEDAAAEADAELGAATGGGAEPAAAPMPSEAAAAPHAAEAAESAAADGGPAAIAEAAGETSSPGAGAEAAPPAAQADPDAAQRVQEDQQARQEQADTRRVAEQTSDERAEEQAEQQAEAGGGSAAPEAQLASGEKDAGLAALGESVGGGGEGAAAASGGGGGGSPAPEPAPVPATAAMDPASGLGAASALQPMQAAQALDGVGSAVDSTAQEECASLQEQMPPVDVGGDGSGGSAVSAPPEGAEAKAAAEAPPGPSQPTPQAEPVPEPGPAPTAAIATPSVANTEQGTVSREDASRVAASVSAMPTTDPGLNIPVGPPPALAKAGDADPGRIKEQQAALVATVADQQARGAADATAPAGENDVRDRSPREVLQAPRLAAPAAGGAGGAAPAEEDGVGIIAEQKQGAAVRGAMAQAQGEMAAKRAEHQGKVAEEKAKSNAEITALKQENASQQQAEKAKVQSEVGKARGAWTAEQNAELARTNEKARGEISKGNEKISQEEKQANEKAAQHISAGEAEAAQHREKAEKEAAAKKQEAERQKEEESGGIFGWIASKVTAFFDALKSAITKVFDAAKKLVKAAIDKAKQLAVAVIEKARQSVVGLIKAVGAALIALGDQLLAAFPTLRKKWRAFIESKVKAAEDAVNRLADALKKGVTRLLDLLGKAFTFLLDAYKKAMLAVLNVAKGAALAAVKAAKAYADLIGTFVVLIKDIAAAPSRWIANLGAAVMDGVRNHLWSAFKTAVKGWFDSKLEEVLGVGTAIWNVLKQGGITLQQVGQMAFEALKAAIPAALIQLLIEKLVAMIVPAAGAVMAIIEGLQAAWPAVQRVIAAAGLFVDFLKAVKLGGAGPKFATMLAAGAVVVIDFVANWLLKKLRGPASKVGSKVKAIAQKIMARIKKALKKVGGWVKGKFKGLKKKFDDWKAKRKAKKDVKMKSKADPSKKKKDKEATKQKRLDAALSVIRPQIARLLSKGVSGLAFRAQLLYLQTRHRLSSLNIKNGRVVARLNPKGDAGTAKKPGSEASGIAKAITPILKEVLEDYDREVLGKGEAKDQVETAKQQILHPESIDGKKIVTMDEWPDDVRQAALREASNKVRNSSKLGLFGFTPGSKAADARVGLGQDVMAKVGHPHYLSRLEIASLDSYPRISKYTEIGRDRHGLSDSQVIGAISASSPKTFAARIAEFNLEGKPGATAPKNAFLRRMRRMSILSSLENARLPEAAVAMQLAADVGAQPGHAKSESKAATVSDLFSREGSKAPQTPVGAASLPSHPDHEEAQRLKHHRVGEIVNWLINEIQRDLVINDGFTAGPLIDAIGSFLKHQRGTSVKKLKSLLMGFLKSRHGR